MAVQYQFKSPVQSQSKRPKEVANAFVIYLRLFKYVRKYWFSLILACFASMCYSGVDAWFIYFLKPLLDKGLADKDQEFLTFAPYLVMVSILLI